MALVLTPLNGLLPAHMLRVVDGGRGPRGPQRLRLDAADAYDRCLRAGMPSGCLRSGYRDRAEQQAEVDRAKAGKTPLAAAPGRSYHGEGTAADVDEPARSWLHRHGAAYGWRGGLIKSEPWHFVYDPEWDRHAPDPTPAPAPDPEEDDDMPRAYYRIPGTALVWEDLGAARRVVSRPRYEAIGHPPLVDLSLSDAFWRLPIVGARGDCYRRPGQEAAWQLDVVDGALVRRWVQRPEYDRQGQPTIVDLGTAHAIWRLPVDGPLPPEGA